MSDSKIPDTKDPVKMVDALLKSPPNDWLWMLKKYYDLHKCTSSDMCEIERLLDDVVERAAFLSSFVVNRYTAVGFSTDANIKDSIREARLSQKLAKRAIGLNPRMSTGFWGVIPAGDPESWVKQ